MKLSKELQQRLMCPVTKGTLDEKDGFLVSTAQPGLRYPLVSGIPVLINEGNSIFSIEDFTSQTNTTFDLGESRIHTTIKWLMPKITHNIRAKANYREIRALLPPDAKVLVVGGSIEGKGLAALTEGASFDMAATDVSYGPLTQLICDAHDLPFQNESFDCVIVQVVLEHVMDPHRCVSEIHRVLKPSGIVYAETPFMQQVHMRQYDFTRFSHLGHRRLFRHFEEIKSGATGGPGMALAWSWTWFLRSFAVSRIMVFLMTFIGYITSFLLKYFDYLIIDKPGAYDAASQFFFIGRKSEGVLSDRELLKQFRGIEHKF